MTRDEAVESLRLKFSSRNTIEVDRAVITREEFEAVIQSGSESQPDYGSIAYLAAD